MAGKIKRGVSKYAEAKLRAIAAEDARSHALAVETRNDALHKTLTAALSDYRFALADALNKQPEFERYKTEFEALLRKLKASSEAEGVFKAIVALNAKHAAMLKDSYYKVVGVVGKKAYYARLKSVLETHFELESFEEGELGGGTFTAFHHEGEDEEIPEIVVTPLVLTLSPPYDDTPGLYEGQGGFPLTGVTNAVADTQDGSFSLLASSGIASGTTARAVVGDFVTVPDGFTRIRATARVSSIRTSSGPWGCWGSAGPVPTPSSSWSGWITRSSAASIPSPGSSPRFSGINRPKARTSSS